MCIPFSLIADGQSDMNIDDFIDILPDRFNANMPLNYRVKNWQAFELGMDHLNEDPDYVRESLARLDKQFDLVIVTEYYDESMVLLAKLLCVPYEVLWQKTLNPRHYEKPILRPDLTDKFNAHFAVDLAIYDHFKHVLMQKITDFGAERMSAEVAKMNTIFHSCNLNKDRCRFERQPVRVRQYAPNVKPSLKYYLNEAESGFGQCPYANSPYQMARRYDETGKLTGCRLHRSFIMANFKRT